jgi:endogenous inhibitor of DNA gyrase (YacG/DUF329 family)
MKTMRKRVRGSVSTYLYGRRDVRCQTCGSAVRPSRAVWRGARPYCSARHEYADLAN